MKVEDFKKVMRSVALGLRDEFTSLYESITDTVDTVKSQLNSKAEADHNHDGVYCKTNDVDTKISTATTAQQEALTEAITSHNSSTAAHADIREAVSDLATRLNAIADSDDVDLDQLSEIVAYIKSNKELIDSITTAKLNVTDLMDSLDSTSTKKGLTANQGRVLRELIDALTNVVGGKVDAVEGKGLSTNDYTTEEKNKLKDIPTDAAANVQADWEESDETSDAFIKNKPTIPAEATKDSVGLGNVPNVTTDDQTPSFTVSTTRENISSGEKMSILFGKIAKWFTDLKTVAFSGSYNDLSDKPSIPQGKADIGLGNVDNTADADKPVSTAQQSAIDAAVSNHNTSETSHADIRDLIDGLTTRLNSIADSDDTTLDQLSEIVAYIKSNKELIDSVTTSKLSVSDLMDSLDSTSTKKGLTANQGRVLRELIEALTESVGKKVDAVTGKGLSSNDYTTEEKTKLGGISAGAEVNVQADWNETNSSSDAYIKNKPTIPAAATKESIGLDKVPNVATNDQTPTFTRAATRSNITSGEKLATILGKISKYFYDLKTVAFTGKFNDLQDKPYLPQTREYKQSVYVVNPRTTTRYVCIASVFPNNTASTNVGIGLKMRCGDYEPTSMATIHFGFACWQNYTWVDWKGFTTTSEWNVNTSVANTSCGASKLKDKLVLVQDPIDTYGVELWLKLGSNEAIYVELDYYTEYNTTGTYPNWEVDAHANVYAESYECMNFVSPDNIKYLDHVPTSTDYNEGQTWEDYPTVQLGSWS